MRHVAGVVFDVGETLVDETSAWVAWADHLGVGRDGFLAALDDVIAAGRDHRDVFGIVAPGFDVRGTEVPWRLTIDDLYPDALAALDALRAAGLAVGIVGNQPATTEVFLRDLPMAVDMVGSSEAWHVAKPDIEFFERVAAEMGLEPARVAYVGDRLDNDVQPALAAGMAAVLVARGPWGTRHALMPAAEEADAVVTDLGELVAVVLDARGNG